ncbi:MAG: energy transducer TonB [Bacteroidota bacterium]
MERWDDIIFKNRNTAYGAYKNRKEYPGGVITGILIAVFFVVGISFIALYSYSDKETFGSGGTSQYEMNLKQPLPQPAQNKIDLPSAGRMPRKKTENIQPVVTHHDENDVDLSQHDIESPKGDTAGTGTGNNNTSGNGQSESDGNGPAPIYVKVEVAPQFPGGEKERNLFLQRNVKYPLLARQYKVQGTVYATFIVEKDGSLSSIKILQGIGCGCDDEVARVVHMMPRWNPGQQNGQAVRVQMLMPVSFFLTIDDGAS